ncbi:hypothetical protein CASFOL_007583 [Castilleja foliolosa]|uniref:Uncharacterized protein n=1 Tax=Castilleja foliolosa TaxID=1961234 RepID=A0ABD3E9N8_9LAMI
MSNEKKNNNKIASGAFSAIVTFSSSIAPLLVLSGKAIQHLASVDHWKRVKGFMWKYGGGMDRVDSFRISEVDYAKWEKKCKTLKNEASKAEPIGPVVQIFLLQFLVSQTI